MICYSAESQTENAERTSLELAYLFFSQLSDAGLMQNPLMVSRVGIILNWFIGLAITRNYRAEVFPEFKGTGKKVDITIQTISRDGVKITVLDTGGKEAFFSKRLYDEYADKISFNINEEGASMQAIFQWRSC